jgi:hypothetical protein
MVVCVPVQVVARIDWVIQGVLRPRARLQRNAQPATQPMGDMAKPPSFTSPTCSKVQGYRNVMQTSLRHAMWCLCLLWFHVVGAHAQTSDFLVTRVGLRVLDGGPATAAYLGSPYGLALDGAGGLYVSDTTLNAVFRVFENYTIVGVSGRISLDVGASFVEAGPAIASSLLHPYGIFADANGSLLIGDTSSHHVRKVSPDGTIRTVVGGFSSGFCGDGTPADSACITSPVGFASDGQGGYMMADRHAHVIRHVWSNRTITSFAGVGNNLNASGYSGDNGPAQQAQLGEPTGITRRDDGSYLIADSGNHAVRMVLVNGTIVTACGNGTSAGYTGDGGNARLAQINTPYDTCIDPRGGYYIADSNNNVVRYVFPNDTIVTYAGSGSGYSGDGGLASDARFISGSVRCPRSIHCRCGQWRYTACRPGWYCFHCGRFAGKPTQTLRHGECRINSIRRSRWILCGR